ncbi:family 20 glycosylhydrolase [Schaalia dentiphila]|uniref:family 20 glycosylhydrolase n=1 Tax=Schaalia dentiphila TaxID=3050224 RepID=UPI0006829AEF|nr:MULTISPECIES: family 20 glycosylhydrolase [Schaalia]
MAIISFPSRDTVVPEGDSQIPHDRSLKPTYAWRGLLIDSSRTFWHTDTMRTVISLMARYGLNTLHWHLTDDAGWRFPLPEYPALTTTGATMPREPYSWYDNVDADRRQETWQAASTNSTRGFYSAEDIRSLVSFAHERGITIVPEVDIPGHMAAAIYAYPELGCPRLAGCRPRTRQWRNDMLWPSQESFRFVEAALSRVCELFDSPVIHVGGDECRWEEWEADEALMERMHDQDVTNGADIQRLFLSHCAAVLATFGRRLAGWDEIVGMAGKDLPTDALVLGWRENGLGARDARASGRQWVQCDADLLYLNRLAGAIEEEPTGMNGIITPQRISEELPSLLNGERLIGVQAAAWSEFLTTPDLLFYHLFPRLLIVAEVAWHGEAALPWSEITPLVEEEIMTLQSAGIPCRPLT